MNASIILSELTFKAIRSSGAGGQHVNKTATKVEVFFHIISSEGLTETEKELLQKRLVSKLTSEGAIILQCGETRSQHRNKKLVIDRLLELLQQNLRVKKARQKTKPSKTAIEKRIKTKKQNALKKASRRPPKID